MFLNCLDNYNLMNLTTTVITSLRINFLKQLNNKINKETLKILTSFGIFHKEIKLLLNNVLINYLKS